MQTMLKSCFHVQKEEIKRVAKEIFGIQTLFPYQMLVIMNILDMEEDYNVAILEKDALSYKNIEEEHVQIKNQIVLFPTGAGKSLCFLLPSFFLNKPTLVIYPLLALMRDQYNKVKHTLNVAIFIGGQTKEERVEEYKKLKTAHIIIANPEILENREVLIKIKEVGISHLAIDEAHCVSEWGDSFRPSYLKISSIIDALNPDIVTAFTATASESVLTRMKELIFKEDVKIIQSSLDRPNLFFSVRHCIVKEPILLSEIEKKEKPLIVFCSSRKRCEDIARLISIVFSSIEVKFYHAGLDREEKKDIEMWFQNAKNAVLVATCAYGMGVDKKDIRSIIHFDTPSTVEAYIQEAGRAGRDRQPCTALLLWSEKDKKRFSQLAEKPKKRALEMESYVNTPFCKRKFLLDALSLSSSVSNQVEEEKKQSFCCKACDVCTDNFSCYPKEISSIYNYIGYRKIDREELLTLIANTNKYWNLQYAQRLFLFLKEKGILKEDKLFWHGKIKRGKDKELYQTLFS